MVTTMTISLYHGDITTLDLNAIVNAANNSLLGGGGVDGAIHSAAGPGLLVECVTLKGCATGDAKITGGYGLPARHVIHTVGPIWHGGGHDEAGLLASCYRRVFALAREHHIKSIAIPAISCGVYGYPVEQAAVIAVRESRAALAADCGVELVTLCCFGDAVLAAYRHALSCG